MHVFIARFFSLGDTMWPVASSSWWLNFLAIMVCFEMWAKINPKFFCQGIVSQIQKINEDTCHWDTCRWMDSVVLKFIFEVLALSVTVFGERSCRGHKYRAVICQDLGWWLCEIETNEEKCIMYMHTHWGKPRGGVLWHHLWARKMALFRTNYNDTLWGNEYRCLSPLSVVFCKASLGMPGHHYFGYLSLPCFLLTVFFTQGWDYPCCWLYRSQLTEPSCY